MLIKAMHLEFDGIWGRMFYRSPKIKSLSVENPSRISPDNFREFLYSKKSHFNEFHVMPIYERQTVKTCDLKVYQDLFVYSFILDNIPKGSKILEVGGGNSRIIECLKKDYEFWNLDKLEGQGQGPKSIFEHDGFFLVKDFIGEMSNKLPNHYFDLIYSVSVVEHFSTDPNDIANIIEDFRRLMKNNAYCLHCIDALIFDDYLWIHPLVDDLKSREEGVIVETDFDKIRTDEDLWVIPNYAYYTRWFPIIKQRTREFGRPFSLNLLWQHNLR